MSTQSSDDGRSNGYEFHAAEFARARAAGCVGVATVMGWSSSLRPGARVLDLGCGSGVPLAAALDAAGFHISGIDASPTLVAMFRSRLPHATVACERVEESRFFERRFDGVLAVGLVFLLPETAQRALIGRVAEALEPGGRFLFTAPARACEWPDAITGRASRSLGIDAYRALAARVGLEWNAAREDEGGNQYFALSKPHVAVARTTGD